MQTLDIRIPVFPVISIQRTLKRQGLFKKTPNTQKSGMGRHLLV